MDLCAAPTGHLPTAMEQHFHQSNHASVVNLDPWDFAFAHHHRQSQSLEEGKVHMHVETLGLESSEAVRDLGEHLTHRGEMIQSFLQVKVRQVVATHFASEEGEKLLVLFDKGVLEIGPQDMVTVLDSLQGSPEFALKVFVMR